MAKYLKKATALLNRRQKHYEEMKRKSNFGGKEYTRPGSMQKK